MADTPISRQRPLAEDDIDVALEEVGRASKVDRIFVFQHDYDPEADQNYMLQRYEWAAEGVESHKGDPRLARIPVGEDQYRMRDLLLTGAPLQTHLADMPLSERAIFEGFGAKSVLIIPVFSLGEFWGFIGFDTVHETRVWTDSEVSLLRLLADRIARALESHELLRDLRRSEIGRAHV